MTPRRIGAYLLPGDPTWLVSSLSSYYDLVDELVVLIPADGMSWTGRPLPVAACLAAIRSVDVAGKARLVEDRWIDPQDPLQAEIAQRQRGVDELADTDWILQLDNDEILPDPDALLRVIDHAELEDLTAIEWPMRVLFRALGGADYLEVVDCRGQPRFEYPGPIAVRPGTRLIDCRRAQANFLRPAVRGDRSSLQVNRPTEPGEVRAALLTAPQAITHNSWGRSPTSIWRKIVTSAHRLGWRGPAYFLVVWLPAPLTWRWLRDLHPFMRPLWPRLRRTRLVDGLLAPVDRAPSSRLRRSASRTPAGR